MITKWIEFKVTAESAAEFSTELLKMQQASRVEPGCSHYSVYRSEDDPCLFTVLESWQTAGHLESHRETAHMAAFKVASAGMTVDKKATSLQALG